MYAVQERKTDLFEVSAMFKKVLLRWGSGGFPASIFPWTLLSLDLGDLEPDPSMRPGNDVCEVRSLTHRRFSRVVSAASPRVDASMRRENRKSWPFSDRALAAHCVEVKLTDGLTAAAETFTRSATAHSTAK